jgi:hypothetical protein
VKAAVVLFAAWSWTVPPTMATAGQAWDAVSTYRSTHGMTAVPCVEVNSVYGSERPEAGKILAVKATALVTPWVVAWFAKRHPESKTLRVINWATGMVVASSGAVPAAHNVSVCGW